MSTKVLFVDPFYEGLAQNVEVVAWMLVIILVFNQRCWLSRERGWGVIGLSFNVIAIFIDSIHLLAGESVHCVSDPTIPSSQWKAARPHLLPTILLPIPDPPYNSQCIPTNPPTAIYRVNIESILKAHSRTPRLQGGTLPFTLWLTFTANQTHFVSWYTRVTAIISSSKDLYNSQAIWNTLCYIFSNYNGIRLKLHWPLCCVNRIGLFTIGAPQCGVHSSTLPTLPIADIRLSTPPPDLTLVTLIWSRNKFQFGIKGRNSLFSQQGAIPGSRLCWPPLLPGSQIQNSEHQFVA